MWRAREITAALDKITKYISSSNISTSQRLLAHPIQHTLNFFSFTHQTHQNLRYELNTIKNK